MSLADQSCIPCADNAAALTPTQIDDLLKQLSGWRVVSEENVLQLRKTYETDDFMAALRYAQRLGELAEQYDHHPSLLVEWGKLTVSWWTHDVSGLFVNDFILAAKSDRTLQS